MSLIEVKLPDIGDFSDVAVIELLVKQGDTVSQEQSLITVESDKASMEIPSPQAGVIKSLDVKIGDKLNQGDLILHLEAASNVQAQPTTESKDSSVAAAVESNVVPKAITSSGPVDLSADVLVLGGGPGGYSAAFRAADLGLSVILVERYGTLGGVCLNVGCIPSKALLHVAGVMEEVKHFTKLGVSYPQPELNLNTLRSHKEKVVGKLTGGLAAMAKMRKVTIVRGVGAFLDANRLSVQQTDGVSQQQTGNQTIVGFKKAIIAAGSHSIDLPFLPKDERIINSTGALSLPFVPKRMLIIGGGIIGLEMATVYSALGAEIDVVEATPKLMAGADADLVKIWLKHNTPRFHRIMLNTKTVSAQASEQGILVGFEGVDAPSPRFYELVLQSVGRKPNGAYLDADKAGVAVDARGFINVDKQQRTTASNIFAIGDVVGQPMLAHKAVHEAHVAAQVIAGELQGKEDLAKTCLEARVIPSVAYTDPEVAWVGVTEEQARAEGISINKGVFPWSASGRAIANGRDEGQTKLIFDATNGRIVGGSIVGTNAGDMIGEVALAIEMGADALDIGKTIHPHPTLGESIGMAAEAAHGSCTDLPPTRKK